MKAEWQGFISTLTIQQPSQRGGGDFGNKSMGASLLDSQLPTYYQVEPWVPWSLRPETAQETNPRVPCWGLGLRPCRRGGISGTCSAWGNFLSIFCLFSNLRQKAAKILPLPCILCRQGEGAAFGVGAAPERNAAADICDVTDRIALRCLGEFVREVCTFFSHAAPRSEHSEATRHNEGSDKPCLG